ncbi:MAG: NTP transferase domain-containing protein [Ignavibacteria bacterium]|nr:NTP transferase domain-containing protein [Ignavibacteria bacterium]
MKQQRRLAVVIMAAGKGTRMKNPSIAKVMYPINDKPLIGHVVDLALGVGAVKTVVVVGWQKDSVIGYLADKGPSVVCVEQSPQLGTGHAVMQAESTLEGFDGDILVLSGDVPMLTGATVSTLITEHRESGADVSVLTALLDDATGYGRIIRNGEGDVTGIVEEKDASEDQKGIREINSGIYLFDARKLFDGLKHITPSNAQNEYYLTDLLGYFWKGGGIVRGVTAANPIEIQGINTLEQLEEARVAMERR